MTTMELISYGLPRLLSGAFLSVQIALAAIAIGFILGTLLGVLQTYGHRAMQSIITAYVWIIRGTPMLIQITFLYYVLPQSGIVLSNVWTAVIAIGLNSSAFVSQIIRSGIAAVDNGQIEAGRVLGLNTCQIIRYVVLPQAIRTTMPALGNEGVTLIKDSSLASIIGVLELHKEAQGLINQTYAVLLIFSMIAILYLILTSTFSLMMHIIQKKLNQKEQGASC